MDHKFTLAASLVTMALIACSGGGPDAQGGAPSCTSSPTTESAKADDSETKKTAREDASEEEAPEKDEREKVASPTDACEGSYSCGLCGKDTMNFWLHFDGERCIFGGDPDVIVLHPDGRVTSDAGQEGNWTGNRLYFRLTYPDICSFTGSGGGYSDVVTCGRLP